MSSITFVLGIHNHQPVGNFDDVIEDAYHKAYKPFLDVLEKHPGVRLALHNSGVLIDWFEARHPEYLDRVRVLVRSGQVELLTGGYYEPILPAIPDADKTGQIRKLTRKLADRLGGTATGLWLTERVWEPSLVLPLKEAGVEYIMVDDSHFFAAGLTPESLWNYWLTEDQGETLGVWSIAQKLRYLIPFEPPEKTIEFLRTLAAGGRDRVALLADDGEKFGVWPDTFERVYAGGWLSKFFGLLEKNAGWIRVALPGDEFRNRLPAGRIYLPTASYSEMMEWSLPTPVQLAFHAFSEKLSQNGSSEARFARGGFWRNFLSKYPESNLMHKRMLETRRHVLESESVPDPVRQAALDDVWQAQCNCAYWHGVFGGLYLPHLRDALYRRILSAESRIDAARHGGRDFLDVQELDLDRDGRQDIRIKNRKIALLLAPGRGGVLEELDCFPAGRNLSHGMSRRHEAYHERLRARPAAGTGPADPSAHGGSVKSIHERVEVKEEGLEKRLFFDWYRRQSLVDHFFRPDTTLPLFDRGEYGEQGDFIESAYRTGRTRTAAGETIRLSRRGQVWVSGRAFAVEVEKTITMTGSSGEFQVDYSLHNASPENASLWFGVEFNFCMLAGEAPDRYYLVDGSKPRIEPHLAGRGTHEGVSQVSLRDDWERLAVSLRWTRPAGLWRLPVETVSLSESGFERVYQSSCVVPHWRILLEPGSVWSLGFRIGVEATG